MTELAHQLVLDLLANIQTDGRAVLIIDGDCASGKTSLAARIAAQISCSVVHMDDFFLPPALRTQARLEEPGGNIHYERFLKQVLEPLPQNGPFVFDAYSCKLNASREVLVSPRPAVVIEGSYALHPRFLNAYRKLRAVKVFLHISPDEQIRRIRNRNGEAMLRRFREEWIPMEKRYRQAYRELWENDVYDWDALRDIPIAPDAAGR